MDLTREQLKEAFEESLGNQGGPVVEEILDNFSDSVLRIVCKGFPKAFKVPLDFEWTKKRTIADLKAYLTERNIPFDTGIDKALDLEDVEWELENAEYRACAFVNKEICTRSFLYCEPDTKFCAYQAQSLNSTHVPSCVSVNGVEVESNIKAETARFFAS